jgi:hypothetical protein
MVNRRRKGTWLSIHITLILMALLVGISGLAMPLEASPVDRSERQSSVIQPAQEIDQLSSIPAHEKAAPTVTNQITTILWSTEVFSRTSNMEIDVSLPVLDPIQLVKIKASANFTSTKKPFIEDADGQETEKLPGVPTSVDLVIFAEKGSVTESWWWISWPWLMALLSALSLVGLVWIKRRRTALLKVSASSGSSQESEKVS